MDKEMLDRCVAAAKAKRLKLINAPLERCWDDIVIAVVEELREPTADMLLEATSASEGDHLTAWQNMIDAIVGDE
jgi:hypothetical protein